MWEVAFWNPAPSPKNIERTSIVPDVVVPARFPHEVTIHQGRIERILEDDLRRYSARGVQRSSKLTRVVLDEAGDAEFPVVMDIEGPSGVRTVRTKHLVGADGAHSLVRRSMDMKLEGETTDFIWGVVDFVAETDFPDIRRRCAIHSDKGSVMVIPREKIATGEYLTRLSVNSIIVHSVSTLYLVDQSYRLSKEGWWGLELIKSTTPAFELQKHFFEIKSRSSELDRVFTLILKRRSPLCRLEVVTLKVGRDYQLASCRNT